jgi:cephalosporin hydroxylase
LNLLSQTVDQKMNQAHSPGSDTLEGWIDSCDEGIIRGWVFDPAQPERVLTVEVLIDGKVTATGIARLERPDLVVAGKKNGRCGFLIPIAYDHKGESRAAQVTVRAQNGSTLPQGEFKLNLATQSTRLSVGLRGKDGLTGCFDQFGPDLIVGWISRTGNPSPPPEIEFWEAGEKVFSFIADMWRTDLEELRQGDGRWGFNLAVPGRLRDGKVHILSVSLAGDREPITANPLRLRFPELPPIPLAPHIRDGDQDRSSRFRLPRTDAPSEVVFSVIINFYNMRREAARTLTSLTRGYQQGIGSLAYEVLCIDNDSSPPLDQDWVESFGPEFRLIRPSVRSPSPCGAINEAARQAKGRYLAIMIDGAHVLSPGVFREAWDAIDGAPGAVVGLRPWFIGGDQRWLSAAGYTREQEDILFDKIYWPENGYKLFKISTPYWESPNHWLDGMIESNCLFVPRNIYERIGGIDEAFDEPGAGYANLDLLTRVVAAATEPLIAILGEATFHQFHDGTTTNVSDREKDNRVRTYEHKYMRLRGAAFSGVAAVDIRQHGQLRARAALGGRQKPLSPARIGVTEKLRKGFPPLHFDEGAATYLQSYYAESGLYKLTKWLGHDVELAPADIIEIQDIVFGVRPARIVTVNVKPGVVLLLNSLLQMIGLPQSRILCVADRLFPDEAMPASVDTIIGEPCAAETISRVKRQIGSEEKVLVLFAPRNHDYTPVEALRLYTGLVSCRSYFIFLGTVFGQPWIGYSKYWFLSAIEAVTAGSGFVIDHSRNRQLVTTCPSGYLQRIKDDGLVAGEETANFMDI